MIVAESREEFDKWTAQQRALAPDPQNDQQKRGKEFFMSGPCVLCHSIAGTMAGARLGPDLTHVASRLTLGAGALPNTRGHLAGWILDSQAAKPGNQMPPNQMSGDDLQALLAYLDTLR